MTQITSVQYEQYQKSLIQYWEIKNVTDTALKESEEKGKKIGKEEGKEEGGIESKMEIAKGMLAEKLPLELIVKLTALTLAEIESLSGEVF